VSIPFQCPYCQARYSVIERAVGRRVRCPFCDELVEVALLAADDQADDAPSADDGGNVAPVEPEEEIPTLPPIAEAPEPEPPPFIGLTPVDPPTATAAASPSRKTALIFRHDRKGQEAEMDMTPMVDVTFLLLIFFMVTASFTMQKSLNIPKPESNEASTQARTVQDFQDNPDYIVLRVDSYNTFHVSASAFDDEIEAPSEQELLVRLRQARQGDASGNIPTKMLVLASGEALHERVVMAIDAGNDVGMDEVQLVTVEEDE
jgi:biopolymer transport protein ExbD